MKSRLNFTLVQVVAFGSVKAYSRMYSQRSVIVVIGDLSW